jgi:hypothetical protein
MTVFIGTLSQENACLDHPDMVCSANSTPKQKLSLLLETTNPRGADMRSGMKIVSGLFEVRDEV